MNPSDPQTLTTTNLFDIHGNPVLRADGPVTGSISLGYDCQRSRGAPTGGWFLRVQFAPIIPDGRALNPPRPAVLAIAGTTVYSGFAYLWLTPGRRPPRIGADL